MASESSGALDFQLYRVIAKLHGYWVSLAATGCPRQRLGVGLVWSCSWVGGEKAKGKGARAWLWAVWVVGCGQRRSRARREEGQGQRDQLLILGSVGSSLWAAKW